MAMDAARRQVSGPDAAGSGTVAVDKDGRRANRVVSFSNASAAEAMFDSFGEVRDE